MVFPSPRDRVKYGIFGGEGAGLHKTGIRGIQDTRQIVEGKTNDKEDNNKKGGFRFLNIRQLMKKQFDTHQQAKYQLCKKPMDIKFDFTLMK